MELSLKHPLIAQLVLDTKWAIKPETFDVILSALKGDGDEKLAAEIRGGKLSEEPRYVELRASGVAVIPVVGPIIPRATFFSEICGIASSEGLMKDFSAAIADPQVKSILFEVDSPGGAVTGISELSQMIYEARGKKPVTAYIRGMGASAAYWAMSGADKVVMSSTAEAGSVGVVMVYKKDTKEEASGIQTIEIVSSVSPKKRMLPTSTEGKAAFQSIVDSLADVMVADIARNRGVTAEEVAKNFGEGFVLVGKDAVDRGMADGVATFEAVISAEMDKLKPKGVFAMDPKDEKKYSVAETDALIKAAKDEGHKAGVLAGAEAERTRISAIEAVPAAGFETLVAENKMKPEMTADKMAMLILTETKRRADAAAAAHGKDAEALAQLTAGAGAQAPAAGAENEAQAAIAAMVAGGQNRRISTK